MPDDALLALAEKGKLHDPAVLRVRWSACSRIRRPSGSSTDFTDQWLDLRDIDATTPDKKLYPEFRPILRDAMLAETRAFFRELLEKDLTRRRTWSTPTSPCSTSDWPSITAFPASKGRRSAGCRCRRTAIAAAFLTQAAC